MDKMELPLLPSMTEEPVPDTLETLPDLTRSTSDDQPNLDPVVPQGEEEDVNPEADHEVVDVESYQPCVVDLTNEEEDDVDVVAVVPQEQPVIYLRTEQRRHNLRRRNANGPLAPPALEDLTRPDQQQHTVFESGGGGRGEGGGTREEEGVMLAGERQHDNWLMNPHQIDFQDPNLVFGNLLNDYPLEAGDNHVPRRHTSLREFRPNTRRQASRSRSPQIPDYSREVTRTPEIVQDVHEMQSEVEDRRPPLHHNMVPGPLVANAVQAVAREHNQMVAQTIPPQAPPSPPAREQPVVSCLVCLDSAGTIRETNRSLCATVCGHIYCSNCIEEVVKRKKQCPVCRKKLTKKQYHPIFI